MQFFPYWVKGIAKPEGEISAAFQSSTGEFAWLKQDGWQVDFSKYEPRKFYKMPTKIKIKQLNTELGYAQSATLVIKEWTFN